MSEQDSDTKVELQKVCKELDEVLVSFMAAMELYQARHAKAVGNIKTVRYLYYLMSLVRRIQS
jgi:hypothetical protein